MSRVLLNGYRLSKSHVSHITFSSVVTKKRIPFRVLVKSLVMFNF